MYQADFKPSFLNKGILWLTLIGVPVSTVLFLTLKIATEYIFFICMMFVSVGVLLIFYFNRFDVFQIIIDDHTIKLFYFNRSFFKTPTKSYTKNEIEISTNNDSIILSKEGTKVGIIRKSAVEAAAWGDLINRLMN